MLGAEILIITFAMTPEREAKIIRVLNNRQPDLAIVMENISDPHNISAVMRTCDAVGVQEEHAPVGLQCAEYAGRVIADDAVEYGG